MQAVPVINIAPFVNEADYSDDERKAVAAQWDQAMTDIGFAIIKGHGVAPEVISNLRNGAMAFFSKDTESKLAFRHGEIGNPDGGWQGMGLESVSRTRDMLGSDGGANLSKALPDLLESYNFKWDSDKPRPVEMDEPGKMYKDEMLRVLSCINHLTALALGLPRDFFDPYYKPCAQTDFRLAYYPPVPKHAQSTSAMRFGEHTDYTGYTILHQDETDVGELDTGGLQVKLNGEWQAVKPQKGTFIVNIGDLYGESKHRARMDLSRSMDVRVYGVA